MISKLLNPFLFVLLLFASCKKESIPETSDGIPVFYFSTDGGPIDITAGENDYYLYTAFERDSLDVMRFIGRFSRDFDCPEPCKGELVVEIRDFQQTSNNTEINIENALITSEYPYFAPLAPSTGDAYVFNFTAIAEGTPPFTYNWLITDNSGTGTPFSGSQVSYAAPLNSNQDTLSICLNTTDSNGCTSTDCDEVRLTPNAIQSCKADYSWESTGAGVYLLVADDSLITGNGPYTYQWSTGQLEDSIVVTINNVAVPFCLTITDTSGCSDSVCKTFTSAPAGGYSVCSAGFSYLASYEPGEPDDFQLSTVKIRYTDPEGEIYHSELIEQGMESKFSITAIEDFDNNEKDEKTKKITVSGYCQLFSENGNAIEFPFNGVIAVAYP